ncbi:glycosyltransferase family 9 protein [Photobacterium japonica]|uniref:glycosyltransferase family 9 protein n=1 Tax=Photobacterium japonica TaxID=2910235 RepID=UPI003D0C1FC8
MALFTTPPASLCILRLSAIGDVCHTISVVQAIQQHWPNTKITWIVGKVEAPLIQALPNVDVVVFDKKAGWKGMQAVWQALKGQRFDALLLMQVALRASLLSFGIRAHYKVGFSRARAKEGQWLFTNKKLPDTQAAHVLDNLAEFARYLGIPFSHPRWDIPLPADASAFAQEQITAPTLVISPAASKDERNWLPERYAQVADYAYQQGLNVVLCGSPAPREVQLGERILSHCHTPVHNLIGQTSLIELVALCKQASIVLAPDSGPAHIATTQGTPVIGLYAHSNPARTGPYNSQAHVVDVYHVHAEKQHGKPVSQLAWGTRVKGDELMQDITVQAVCTQIDHLLASLSHPLQKRK